MNNILPLGNRPTLKITDSENKQRAAHSMRQHYFNINIIAKKNDDELIELFYSPHQELESNQKIDIEVPKELESPRSRQDSPHSLPEEARHFTFEEDNLTPKSDTPSRKKTSRMHSLKLLLRSPPSSPRASNSKESTKKNPFVSKFYNTLERRLCAAVCKNHTEILQYGIKDKTFDINHPFQVKLNFLPDSNSPVTLLAVAVAKKKVALTKLLLNAGAHQQNENVLNNNPLHIAAQYGNEPNMSIIIEMLLKNADPNFQNADGDTALMVAVRRSQYNVIPHLLEKGTNINLQNLKGETAFQIGLQTIDDKNAQILNSLNPNLKNENKLSSVPSKSLDELDLPSTFNCWSIVSNLFQSIFKIFSIPFILLKKSILNIFQKDVRHPIKMSDLTSKLFKILNPKPYVYFAIKTGKFENIELDIQKDMDEIYEYKHGEDKQTISNIKEAYDNLIFILRKNISNKLDLDRLASENDIKGYYFTLGNYRELYNDLKKKRKYFADMKPVLKSPPRMVTDTMTIETIKTTFN